MHYQHPISFFDVATLGHGRRKGTGGANPPCPLGFWNFQKKGCFFSFEWEKQISPLLVLPWKNFGKNPSDAHALGVR